MQAEQWDIADLIEEYGEVDEEASENPVAFVETVEQEQDTGKTKTGIRLKPNSNFLKRTIDATTFHNNIINNRPDSAVYTYSDPQLRMDDVNHADSVDPVAEDDKGDHNRSSSVSDTNLFVRRIAVKPTAKKVSVMRRTTTESGTDLSVEAQVKAMKRNQGIALLKQIAKEYDIQIIIKDAKPLATAPEVSPAKPMAARKRKRIIVAEQSKPQKPIEAKPVKKLNLSKKRRAQAPVVPTVRLAAKRTQPSPKTAATRIARTAMKFITAPDQAVKKPKTTPGAIVNMPPVAQKLTVKPRVISKKKAQTVAVKRKAKPRTHGLLSAALTGVRSQWKGPT